MYLKYIDITKNINFRYFKNIWKYPCYPRHLFQLKRVTEIFVFLLKFWVKLHPSHYHVTFKTNASFWRNWLPNCIRFMLNQWAIVPIDVITGTATDRCVFQTRLTFSANNSSFACKIKIRCGWTCLYTPSIIPCKRTITFLQWCFLHFKVSSLNSFTAQRLMA